MDFDETNGELEWRDTYYILFQRENRPTLQQVEAVISDATKRVKLENLDADEEGLFESVLVQAPEDNAALEISFESGEAVVEQSLALAEHLKDDDSFESDQLAALLRADARFDVMHFERLVDEYTTDDEDGMPEALDPASLLQIVDVLARLTDGLPIDPGSGVIMG